MEPIKAQFGKREHAYKPPIFGFPVPAVNFQVFLSLLLATVTPFHLHFTPKGGPVTPPSTVTGPNHGFLLAGQRVKAGWVFHGLKIGKLTKFCSRQMCFFSATWATGYHSETVGVWRIDDTWVGIFST